MDIVNELVSKLGIDTTQAKGGIGMILGMAKDKLDGGDFDKVKEAIPEADQLVSDAPDTDEGGGGILGAVGGLASNLGIGGSAGDLMKLAGGFDKLGLDASMITKFVPIILGFVKGKGGGAVGDILGSVLGGKD